MHLGTEEQVPADLFEPPLPNIGSLSFESGPRIPPTTIEDFEDNCDLRELHLSEDESALKEDKENEPVVSPFLLTFI